MLNVLCIYKNVNVLGLDEKRTKLTYNFNSTQYTIYEFHFVASLDIAQHKNIDLSQFDII